MNLSERLNEDMKQAMKSKDKFKLSTIRLIRSTIKNLEIDLKRTLDDNEVLDILSREIKQRKDALQEFDKAGREELAANAKAEIDIIGQYLPHSLPKKKLKLLYSRPSRKPVLLRKPRWGKSWRPLCRKLKAKRTANWLIKQFNNFCNKAINEHLLTCQGCFSCLHVAEFTLQSSLDLAWERIRCTGQRNNTIFKTDKNYFKMVLIHKIRFNFLQFLWLSNIILRF